MNATKQASTHMRQTATLFLRSIQWATIILIWSPLAAFAQAAGGGGGGFAQLTTALSNALGIVMLIAFFMGVIAIINGGMSIWRGDTAQGKLSLVAGIVIAGSSVIVAALFQIFGLQALTPTFN